MNKKRGQALVEFVIILPIFIFFLFAIIDLGKMLFVKNQLESEMNEIIEKYKREATFMEIQTELDKNNKNAKLEIEKEDEYIHFLLKEKNDVITPGLNLIFQKPYYVEVERWIKNES